VLLTGSSAIATHTKSQENDKAKELSGQALTAMYGRTPSITR
jgi:hypothetical protein